MVALGFTHWSRNVLPAFFFLFLIFSLVDGDINSNGFLEDVAVDRQTKTEITPTIVGNPDAKPLTESDKTANKKSHLSLSPDHVSEKLQECVSRIKGESPAQLVAVALDIAKSITEQLKSTQESLLKKEEELQQIIPTDINVSSKDFEGKAKKLEEELEKLVFAVKELGTGAKSIALFYADRGDKEKHQLVQDSNQLLHLIYKEVGKAVKRRAESVTSFVTHLIENFSASTTRQKDKSKESTIEQSEEGFKHQKSAAIEAIETFISKLKSGEENETDFGAADAITKIKEAESAFKFYKQVVKNYDDTQKLEEQANELITKALERAKGGLEVVEKYAASFPTVKEYLKESQIKDSNKVRRRKKRSAIYEQHQGEAEDSSTKISTLLESIKVKKSEMEKILSDIEENPMPSVSAVGNLLEAVKICQTSSTETVEKMEWVKRHSNVMAQCFLLTKKMHALFEDMKSNTYKVPKDTGDKTKQYQELNNKLENQKTSRVEIQNIMKALNEYNAETVKNSEDLVKLKFADKEKKTFIEALENMEKARTEMNKILDFYFDTHLLAKDFRTEYKKIKNKTDADMKLIQESIEKVIENTAENDRDYTSKEKGHNSELLEKYKKGYKELEDSLLKHKENYASLLQRKDGLKDENGKSLHDQLEKMEAQMEKLEKHIKNNALKISEAEIVYQMLEIEQSVKQFERNKDKVDKEFMGLCKIVREDINHDFPKTVVHNLEIFDKDINDIDENLKHLNSKINEIEKILKEKEKNLTKIKDPALSQFKKANEMRERIEKRLDLLTKSMESESRKRTELIYQVEGHIFHYQNKDLDQAKLDNIKENNDKKMAALKLNPTRTLGDANELENELTKLKNKKEAIFAMAKEHHDKLGEDSLVKQHLNYLTQRLNDMIASSKDLLHQFPDMHLAIKAEEEDKQILADLVKLQNEGGELHKLGVQATTAVAGLEDKVKRWAGFRPEEKKIVEPEKAPFAQLEEYITLAKDSYTNVETVEKEAAEFEDQFIKLIAELENYKPEKGKKLQIKENLATKKHMDNHKASKHVYDQIVEEHNKIENEITKTTAHLNERIKTLSQEKNQSLAEIKAIEASVRLFKLYKSLVQPLSHLTLVIQPKLEHSTLMENCNCEENFMSAELAEMNNTVTLANQVKADAEKEQLYAEAAKFNQLMQVLKRNTRNASENLLDIANKLTTVLENFIKEMIKNIEENIAKSKKIEEEFQAMELQKEDLIKNFEITRKNNDEAYRKTSKEEGGKESKAASIEAEKEASKEATEKARRMGSEEDSKVERLKADFKVGMKKIIKERIKEEKKVKRILTQHKELHKQLYELIKKLLAIRNKVNGKEREFFDSPEREIFLKKKGVTADKPTCQKYIREIEIVKGQGIMLSDTIRNELEPKHDLKENENKPYIQMFIELGTEIFITPLELKMIQDGKVVENGDTEYEDNNNKMFKAAIEKLKESIKEQNRKLFETPKNELESLIEQQKLEKVENFRKMFEGANKHEQKENYKKYLEYVENFERVLNENKNSIEKTKNIVKKYLKAENPPFWPFTPDDGDLVGKKPDEFERKLGGIYNASGNSLYKGYRELFDLKENELHSMKNPAMIAYLDAQKELLKEAEDKNIDISNPRDVIHPKFHKALKSGYDKKLGYLDKNNAL